MPMDNFNLFVVKTISDNIIINEIDFNDEEKAKDYFYISINSLKTKNDKKINKILIEKKHFIVESYMLKEKYFEQKNKNIIIKEKEIICNITNNV